MKQFFGKKYVKGITQFIDREHFGAKDFIDYKCESLGMSRAEYMAYYGSSMDESANPEIEEAKPGPDPYLTGLDDETEEEKEDAMKKQAKMDDDDPEAYKDLPGDEEAREKGKVKTSKHVKKYHELYGESEKKSSLDSLSEAEQSTDRSPIDDDAIETGLKNKSDETGVPIGIIRAVMRRGMAAWKTGHRPGATQQQWGYARVNSFLTKSEGTWGKADSDLAKEVRDGGHDKKLKS